MAKKEFVFTNENLYDQNIFGKIFPNFILALESNDLDKLFNTTQSMYFLTQHFYQTKSKDILELLATASEQINKQKGRTHTEAREISKLNAACKTNLLLAWTTMCNKLHASGFFKKSFTTDSYDLPLTKK